MRRATVLVFCLSLIVAACGDDSATDTTEVPDGSVVVPDVVGESAAFATGVLEANGLATSVVEEAIDGAEPGTVVEQVPAAGSTADEGATVVLRVAAESDRTTTTSETESSTTSTSGGGDTSSTTSGGGGTTSTTAGTTTSSTTTTTAAATAPDDGGDGSGSPEHFLEVESDGSAVVLTEAISVPGDRGDGINIRVEGLNQGENADLHVTFSCDPGGPRVNDAFGYSGGSVCDTTYTTTEFAGYQSNQQSFWIYVPDGVEGLFTYSLTLVAIER